MGNGRVGFWDTRPFRGREEILPLNLDLTTILKNELTGVLHVIGGSHVIDLITRWPLVDFSESLRIRLTVRSVGSWLSAWCDLTLDRDLITEVLGYLANDLRDDRRRKTLLIGRQ